MGSAIGDTLSASSTDSNDIEMFRIATRVWMVTRNPAFRHIRAIDRSLGTGQR